MKNKQMNLDKQDEKNIRRKKRDKNKTLTKEEKLREERIKKVSFKKLYKPFIPFSILALVLELITILVQVAIPFFTADIIDNGIAFGDLEYVKRVGFIMIIIAIAGLIVSIINVGLRANISNKFAKKLRKLFFEKVNKFSFKNLDEFNTSTLLTRATSDISTIQTTVMRGHVLLFKPPFMFVSALFFAVSINPKLTSFVLLIVPPIILIAYLVRKKTKVILREMQKLTDKINKTVKENLSGIKVVKIFNLEEKEKQKFNERNISLRNKTIEVVEIMVMIYPLLSLIVNMLLVAVVFVGRIEITNGNIKIGEFISLISYITYLVMSILGFTGFLIVFFSSLASIERVKEVLGVDTKTNRNNEDENIKLKNFDIEVKNLKFAYDSKELEKEQKNRIQNIIKGITLEIKEGENIGIIGYTGSGKSTLMNLILGNYTDFNGIIKIGGRSLKKIPKKYLYENIAFVPQIPQIFSGTVKENLSIGKKDATEDEIIKALKIAEAWDFVSKYEDGIDHYIYQEGDNLSGGQKQRIQIARAVIKNPKVLILDDSTSMIDAQTEIKLWNNILENFPESTIILISQKITSIKRTDKIFLLKDGLNVATGNHETLLKESDDYKEIYDFQIRSGIDNDLAIEDEDKKDKKDEKEKKKTLSKKNKKKLKDEEKGG